MKSRLAGALLALCLCMIAARPAFADSLVQDDYFRHPGEEMQRTEFWTSVLRSDDGWTLYLSYLVTNLGIGSGNTGYAVSLTSPGGKVYRTKGRYPDTTFSEDHATGVIRVGPHRLRLRHPDFQFVIDDPEKDVSLDLHLKAWSEGYKFGDGHRMVSKKYDYFVDYFFLVPRADVTGTITVEGKKHEFKGDGYLEHLVTNRSITQWSRRWHVFFGFDDDMTVHLMLGYPTPNRPELEGRLGYFAVTDKDGVVFAARRPNLTFRKPKQEVEGCYWPEDLRIEAKTKKGSARVLYHSTKLHDAYVALSQLAWPLRDVVARIVGNPIFLRFHNNFDLELEIDGKIRKVQGKGLHQIICLD